MGLKERKRAFRQAKGRFCTVTFLVSLNSRIAPPTSSEVGFKVGHTRFLFRRKRAGFYYCRQVGYMVKECHQKIIAKYENDNSRRDLLCVRVCAMYLIRFARFFSYNKVANLRVIIS